MTSKTSHIHIVQGDISRIQADVLVFSTSTYQTASGDTYKAMIRNVPGFEDAYRNQKQPFSSSSVYWLSLPNTQATKRPRAIQGVVVGQTVIKDRATVETVSNVAKEAVLLALEKGTGDRIILAMPALGSGQGEGFHLAKQAEAQISAAAEALTQWQADQTDQKKSIEVVMVAYGRAAFLRFLAAKKAVRDSLGGSWPCHEPSPDQNIVNLAKKILHQECVLFVGSGLSFGAGLPSWEQLIRRLLDDLPEDVQSTYKGKNGSPPKALTFDDFLDIASWHRFAWEDQKGTPNVKIRSHIEHIKELFSDRANMNIHPTLAHYLLLSMPWRHVITTNYDTLIERTLEAQRIPIQLISTDEHISLAGRAGATTVIKFHGHAADDTNPEQDKAIVLTRTEYENFFDENPAKALLLEGLLLNHNFLFYGYSLSDHDFRLIYNRVGRILGESRRAATAASLGPYIEYQKRSWKAKGLDLVNIDGADPSEREVHLLRWLSVLLEQATPTIAPILANKDSPEGELQPLEEVHKDARSLGDTLMKAINALPKGDSNHAKKILAAIEPLLDALETLGWRPSPSNFSGQWVGVWTHLASCVDGTERQRLLNKALAVASNLNQIDKIKAELLTLHPQ